MEVATKCGWGLAVAWAPSGTSLAFCGQLPKIGIAQSIDLHRENTWEEMHSLIQFVDLPGLPLKSLAFARDDLVIGGGFDFKPAVLQAGANGAWSMTRFKEASHALRKIDSKVDGASVAAKIRRFETRAAEGPEAQAGKGAHTNCITGVLPLKGKASGAAFLTGALDGKVITWMHGAV